MKRNISLIILIVIPLLIVVLYRYLYGYIYHAVDDVTINYSILNKEYMLLPYMGIVLTKVLVILQSLFSNVNIYFIFLVSAYSISFSCLLYLLRDKKYKIVLWIIVLVIEFALLKYFTYSVVAYLLSLSGIFLLYKEKNIVFPIILIFTGISLRVQIITSLLAICLAIIIFELIRNKKAKQTGILISTIFIVGLTNWLFIQSNDVEKSYIEWNEKSTLIRDYPAIDYSTKKASLDKIGITENTLASHNSWILSEKQVFSNELLDNLDKVRLVSEKYNFSIKKIILEYFSNEFYKLFTFFVLLVFIFYKSKSYYGYLLFLSPLALLTALIVRQRVVERVYVSIIILALFIFIVYRNELFIKRNYKLLNDLENVIFTVLCILLMGYIWNYGKNELYWFNYHSHDFNKVYNNVLANNKDNLYIISGYGNLVSSQPNVSKVFVKTDKLTKNIITFGTWQTFSPEYHDKLNEFGVKDTNNILSSAVNSDNIKFILPKDSSVFDKIRVLFKENYDRDIYFVKESDISDDMNIYILRSDK